MIDSPLVNYISEEFDVTAEIVERLIQRAPYTYKTYSIKKKNGGTRTISQPARETKHLQRWLINRIFNDLPIHSAASAYKEGASIKKNALNHAKNSYISKYDFRNFFPSIKAQDIKLHLEQHLDSEYSDKDLDSIVRISCKYVSARDGLRLSIGSPSSPLLSNSVMYKFDELLFDWCIKNSLVYSRYADDLTFSTNEKGTPTSIEGKLKEVLASLEYPRLRLNRQKTIHLSKKNNRRITGITITNEGQLSLGRDRKRLIRSMIHRFLERELNDEDIYKLQGLLAFSKDVEPKFIERMEERYGSAAISEILSKRKEKLVL
jgi:retron-type reverse transcriptase